MNKKCLPSESGRHSQKCSYSGSEHHDVMRSYKSAMGLSEYHAQMVTETKSWYTWGSPSTKMQRSLGTWWNLPLYDDLLFLCVTEHLKCLEIIFKNQLHHNFLSMKCFVSRVSSPVTFQFLFIALRIVRFFEADLICFLFT